MPKIDRTQKNVTPKIWEEMHSRQMFYGTLIFQQSMYDFYWPPCWRAYYCPTTKTTFSLYLVKHLIVVLRCAVNIITSSFQHFPWSLSANFEFRMRWFKILKSHFGHVTSCKLTHFKKMVLVQKAKSLLFCLRYDLLIVFQRQNHVTLIFIKTMSHDLLVQMAHRNSLLLCEKLWSNSYLFVLFLGLHLWPCWTEFLP